MPTLMSAIAQPSFTGMTAQASIARAKVSIGAIRNSSRFDPDGMIVSFISIFSASAKGCAQAERADDVRALAQLHRRQDLAFGVGQVGDADQQRHQQRQRLDERSG